MPPRQPSGGAQPSVVANDERAMPGRRLPAGMVCDVAGVHGVTLQLWNASR